MGRPDRDKVYINLKMQLCIKNMENCKQPPWTIILDSTTLGFFFFLLRNGIVVQATVAQSCNCTSKTSLVDIGSRIQLWLSSTSCQIDTVVPLFLKVSSLHYNLYRCDLENIKYLVLLPISCEKQIPFLFGYKFQTVTVGKYNTQMNENKTTAVQCTHSI